MARTSGLAVAAFVCSLLGLWIAGIPMGYTSRNEIDRSRGTLGGRGYATAAIVLGWLGLALTIVVVIIVVNAAKDGSSAGSSYQFVPCSEHPEAIGC